MTLEQFHESVKRLAIVQRHNNDYTVDLIPLTDCKDKYFAAHFQIWKEGNKTAMFVEAEADELPELLQKLFNQIKLEM